MTERFYKNFMIIGFTIIMALIYALWYVGVPFVAHNVYSGLSVTEYMLIMVSIGLVHSRFFTKEKRQTFSKKLQRSWNDYQRQQYEENN